MMVLQHSHHAEQRSTCRMRSSHSLDRIDTAFDGTQLVADAGLLLPATLARHLGLKALVEEHLDLGQKPGAPNCGDKLMTLVMSALAGGDCIDDAAALRAGGMAKVLGFPVKAASTLGTFLRSFRWGHVRQLDAVSRHLLARAWAAGDPGEWARAVVPLAGEGISLARRSSRFSRSSSFIRSRSSLVRPERFRPSTSAGWAHLRRDSGPMPSC